MPTNIEGELHKPRRNIMRSFKLLEISAVDRPAQEHAKAMIIKRNQNAGDADMDAKELEKKVADLTAELVKAREDGDKATKELDALKAANAQLAEDAKFAAIVDKAGKPPWLQDMKDEPDADDEDKKKDKAKKRREFLALSVEARDKLITEKRTNDEVVTIDGEEIRKSAVGAAQFAIFKRQAERIAALEKSNQDAIAKAETAELTKRAEDEFPHLPGSVDEKVSVLRAIGKADKPTQEAFKKMVVAGEKAIVSAFDKVGHRGGDQTVEKGAFEKRVAEVLARDKGSRTEAMEKARKEFPAEFAAYQGQN